MALKPQHKKYESDREAVTEFSLLATVCLKFYESLSVEIGIGPLIFD